MPGTNLHRSNGPQQGQKAGQHLRCPCTPFEWSLGDDALRSCPKKATGRGGSTLPLAPMRKNSTSAKWRHFEVLRPIGKPYRKTVAPWFTRMRWHMKNIKK